MTTSGSEKLDGYYQLSVKGGDTFSGVIAFLPLSADYESRLKPRSDLNPAHCEIVFNPREIVVPFSLLIQWKKLMHCVAGLESW